MVHLKADETSADGKLAICSEISTSDAPAHRGCWSQVSRAADPNEAVGNSVGRTG
jgi:hypothetical protein